MISIRLQHACRLLTGLVPLQYEYRKLSEVYSACSIPPSLVVQTSSRSQVVCAICSISIALADNLERDIGGLGKQL
jgi:hypothetical protein